MEHGSPVTAAVQCLRAMSRQDGGGPGVPTAVLDTNVVLDWLVFDDARVAALVGALAAGTLHAIATPAMRHELACMLASQRLQRWAPDAAAALQAYDRSVRMLDDAAAHGPWPAGRPRCTDADDQVFIDLALTQRARWLLTHDRALLRLARRLRSHGVQVLTPMGWAAQAGAGVAGSRPGT